MLVKGATDHYFNLISIEVYLLCLESLINEFYVGPKEGSIDYSVSWYVIWKLVNIFFKPQWVNGFKMKTGPHRWLTTHPFKLHNYQRLISSSQPPAFVLCWYLVSPAAYFTQEWPGGGHLKQVYPHFKVHANLKYHFYNVFLTRLQNEIRKISRKLVKIPSKAIHNIFQ